MENYKKISDIQVFENHLKEYFQDNLQTEDIQIKYTDEERKKINNKMNLALQYRSLKKMMGRSNVSNMTFSQNLYNLRIKNKLTKSDMQNILEIETSLIDDLESGRKRIDSLNESIIANILAKLRITISQYIQLLQNELKTSAGKSKSLEAFARSKSTLSHDDRSKKMQHGIDAVMLEISKRKKSSKTIDINKNHIENIKKHLTTDLDEIDLLK